jgi:hypothetical protein
METPRRTLPRETVAWLRRQRARKRIEKRAPLFAEQFYAEELAGRANYYAGGANDAAASAWQRGEPVYREEIKANPAETGELHRDLVRELVDPHVFFQLDVEQKTHWCGQAYEYWREMFTMLCNYSLDGNLAAYRANQVHQQALWEGG